MIKNLHDIDQLFQNAIEDHLEDVPPGVWDNIDHHLDKKQVVSFKQKYSRLRRVAAVLLFFCIMGGVYALYMHEIRQGHGDATAAPNRTEQNSAHRVAPGHAALPAAAAPASTSSAPASLMPEQMAAPATAPLDPARTSHAQASRSKPQAKAPVYRSQITTVRPLSTTATRTAASSATAALIAAPTASIRRGTAPAETSPAGIPSLADLAGKHAGGGIGADKLLPLHLSTPFAPAAPGRKDIASSTAANMGRSGIQKDHGIALTAFFAPDLGFDHLRDNGHFAGPGNNRDEARKNEQETTSFTIGLLADYSLSPKWSLQSGFTLSSSVTSIAPTTVYAHADNNGRVRYEVHCSSGYAYITPKSGSQLSAGDSAKMTGSTSKLQYASVPLSLSFHLSAGRFSFSPAAGFAANFLVRGRVSSSIDNGATHEGTQTALEGLRPVYFNSLIGFGIEYRLSRLFSVSFMPTGRIALTSINKDTPVKSYQNHFSMATGLRIRL